MLKARKSQENWDELVTLHGLCSQDRTGQSLTYDKADVLIGVWSPLAAGAQTREISTRQSSLESFLEEED